MKFKVVILAIACLLMISCSESNLTVMAVDTCPNALAIDTSAYFGEMLIKHVFAPLLRGEHSPVVEGSTIVDHGRLTPKFDYLTDFAAGK